MSDPDLTLTQSVERGWVMIVGGDQITSIYGHEAFLRTIHNGSNDIRPRISGRRALYVLAEPDGVIRAACAFTIGFDADGEVRHDSAVPMRELALRSGDGADLGWGRIRLACACQCARPEFVDQLWGDQPWDLLPALVDAQRLLRERSRSPARPLQEGATIRFASAQGAGTRAEQTFGVDGVLSSAQLARGRSLAHQALATAPGRTENAPISAGSQASFTPDEVRALREQDRRRLARLEREVHTLRRRLGTVLQD